MLLAPRLFSAGGSVDLRPSASSLLKNCMNSMPSQSPTLRAANPCQLLGTHSQSSDASARGWHTGPRPLPEVGAPFTA
eukprot:9394705-Lingulodinium_polyedra.AAC.1